RSARRLSRLGAGVPPAGGAQDRGRPPDHPDGGLGGAYRPPGGDRPGNGGAHPRLPGHRHVRLLPRPPLRRPAIPPPDQGGDAGAGPPHRLFTPSPAGRADGLRGSDRRGGRPLSGRLGQKSPCPPAQTALRPGRGGAAGGNGSGRPRAGNPPPLRQRRRDGKPRHHRPGPVGDGGDRGIGTLCAGLVRLLPGFPVPARRGFRHRDRPQAPSRRLHLRGRRLRGLRRRRPRQTADALPAGGNPPAPAGRRRRGPDARPLRGTGCPESGGSGLPAPRQGRGIVRALRPAPPVFGGTDRRGSHHVPRRREVFSVRRREWKNWSGSARFRPKRILYPASVEEVAGIIRQAADENKSIRVVGSGHSFTPRVETNGILLSLDRFRGLEAVDKERRLVTVRAGTKLKELGELLHGHGLAQENLGDINAQSIAGAISTGTHGTGTDFGILSTQVAALTLVNARGEVVECSPDRNPQLFKAAQVSLGALGVIVRVTLRVLPRYRLHYRSGRMPLEDCLNRLDRYRREHRHFEFYWFPHTDLVQVKFMDETDRAASAGGLWSRFSKLFLENGAFWLLSETARRFPRLCPSISRLSARGVPTVEEVGDSHRLFATPRLVRFNEMEYALPAAGSGAGDPGNHPAPPVCRPFPHRVPVRQGGRHLAQSRLWPGHGLHRGAHVPGNAP